MNLFGLLPEEFQGVLLSLGNHRGRRPLSPVEAATCLNKMKDSGASLKDCAAAVHLDGTGMISRFLRLLDLTPEIQHLIDWGQSGATIGFTGASELARLPQDQQLLVARAVIERQLTGAEVKQIVQRIRRSHRSVGDAIDDIVKLRPTVEQRHLYIGSIASDRVTAFLASQSQEQRDQILRDVLLGILPHSADVSARLGRTRFTIASKETVEQAVSGLEPDLEARVNAALEQRVVSQ